MVHFRPYPPTFHFPPHTPVSPVFTLVSRARTRQSPAAIQGTQPLRLEEIPPYSPKPSNPNIPISVLPPLPYSPSHSLLHRSCSVVFPCMNPSILPHSFFCRNRSNSCGFTSLKTSVLGAFPPPSKKLCRDNKPGKNARNPSLGKKKERKKATT